jgi:3-oxoacyl-[acyl-carrier-protein] synthase-3
MLKRAVIEGIGHGLPSRVLTNQDLEKIVDTSDEWIVQRTGIRERRICAEGESTSTLVVAAAREALAAAEVEGSEVDLVVCATVSGDYIWPATACVVQDAVGAKGAAAFDVSAACAGFIYSLAVSSAMIQSGQARTALVMGSDCLSKQVDWSDRSTCILFGDAAGAVVLRGYDPSETNRGLIETVLYSDGSGRSHIKIEAGGTKYPYSEMAKHGMSDRIQMAGSEVFRFAVQAMGDACCRVLEKAGMTPDQIDLFVPHQANLRIIDAAAKRLGLPSEKVFVNVHKYGNTSGGSVPLALYEAQAEGRLKKGMTVMTVGFGAGLVWGANIIRW